jgi:flavodoxin
MIRKSFHMKTLIICISLHHKNTQKIAQQIGKVLEAKIISPDKVDISKLNTFDLIGFGSGIYYSLHHEDLFNLIDKFVHLNKKKAFIFSTSGSWNIKYLNDFNAPLHKKLESKGLEIIGIFNCRGYDTIGPLKHIGGLNKGKPDQKDLKNAAVFAQSIKHTVEALI